MNSNDIKLNLSRAREAAGLTQDALADMVGISRTTYRSIEKGETKLIYGRLDEICGVLGISVEEVLLGYSPRKAGEDELMEEEFLQEKIRTQREYYENRITALEEKIASLSDTLQIKEDSIKTLRDINDRLFKEGNR